MPISPRVRVGAAALAIGIAALPAIGQDRPESILPPGFGQPAATPAPAPSGSPVAPVPGATATGFIQPLPIPAFTPLPSPSATPSATPTPLDPAQLAEYELPSFARRSLARVGPAGDGVGGLAPDAFGNADGRYLEGLMRRIAAPLPSRWMSILLRRTLASEIDTPRSVNGADFAAERAWLLLRMGESVVARGVAQSVDIGNTTPKLLEVSMNTALATGDPAELCPLVDRGIAKAGERGWIMARAMCASLAGNAARGKALMAEARRRKVASGLDLLLAQKVSGAGPNGNQAITIEWGADDTLTVWRYGLAMATGAAIPAEIFATTGPQVTYWRALSPGALLADRVTAADAAARQGVLSNDALVSLYAEADQDDDAPAAASGTAQSLRTAYTADTVDGRVAAIKEIWGTAAAIPYDRLVLTARAASRLPTGSAAKDADGLVAAMLTAGLDRRAAQWAPKLSDKGDAWAMIALSDPDRAGAFTYSDVSGYSGKGNADRKKRLLFAGLAGLGRLSPDDIERGAQSFDVRIGVQNAWTRAIDRAAESGQPGTVVLLAAAGMQTPAWGGVPPEMLYRIVAALRRVGLDGEARMIAAEAIARV